MSTDPGLGGYVPATGSSDPAFYNPLLDAPVDPTVPEILLDTRAIVTQYLDLNHDFVITAVDTATAALTALAAAHLPPALPDPPPAPSIVTSISSGLGLTSLASIDLGDLSPEAIEQFNPDSITVPDVLADKPLYTSLGLTIVLPDAPTLDSVTEPTAPAIITDFDFPDAPAKDYGGSPDLEEYIPPTLPTLTTPEFNDAVPTFDVLAPEPVIQWAEPVYTSDIKTAVQNVLVEMLAGGTGLPAAVEDAIWERGREREDMAALSIIDAAFEEWAARGFEMPVGLLNKQVMAAREQSARKINDLSRDVMVKQADLEQKNRQFAVEKGIDFERVFTAIFLAVVERNFEIAKFAVETQINIYNLKVTAFKVELDVYNSRIAKYRIDLDIALFGLQIFRAQVEAEKAKGELNLAKVQAFKAKVEAYSAQVDAYKAIVQAVGFRADAQKNIVEIYKSQIDAMIGKINAQRAKFDAYDSRIKGEATKATLEETNARVYTAQVQGWAAGIEGILKQTDVDLRANQQKLDYNVANIRRVSERTSAELAVIQARLASFQATTSAAVAEFNSNAESARVDIQAKVSLSQVAIARYAALLEQWKTRSQEVIQFGLAAIESQRTIAQVTGNWVSGAMAGTHVSAGISAGASAGQTSSRTAQTQASQNRNVNENSNYSIVHNYQHRT